MVVAGQGLHLVHLATVCGQVARAGEAPPAGLTAVGSLPGVHPPVVPQAPRPREGRRTLPALVRLQAGVDAQVVVEARLLPVARPAHLTDVGPLVVVVDQVLLQVGAEGEGLGAARALEALVLLVPHHVGLDALDLPPAQPADGALAVLAVRVQLLAVREGGAADFAQPALVPPAAPPPRAFPLPPPTPPPTTPLHPLPPPRFTVVITIVAIITTTTTTTIACPFFFHAFRHVRATVVVVLRFGIAAGVMRVSS